MRIEVKNKQEAHPEGLTETQEELALQLFDIGAIQFGNFRFKLHEKTPEAPLAPVYIDLRILRRFPEVKRQAVDIYEKLILPLDFDLLADVPTAVTPLVSSLSDRLKVGMITPRTDTKSHGSGAKIDGFLKEDEGKKAVLIDDAITTGTSILEALEILENEGIKVENIVVLVDREQGGRNQLEEKGYKLHAAFTLKQMLDFYARVRRINQETHQDTLERLNILNEFLRG